MEKRNLRAAFAFGSTSGISAQQVFTDRISEVGAFDTSLELMATEINAAALSPVVDRSVPRKNVLVFYGVGGIGKTTLSRELENRFSSGTSEPRATVRIDFGDPSSLDFESVLLRARAAFGVLAPRWPAFDLALGVYWAKAHPGEPMEEFLARDSLLSRTAQQVGLSDQVAATIGDVIGDMLPGVAGAAHRIGGTVFGRIKDAVARHRVLAQCDLLVDLIEAPADIETLSYFAYLLAWDLDRLPLRHPRAVIFLDTFENVNARGMRDVERLLQRLIFLMPNVLFVVTGRSRVDWADGARVDELDYIGPGLWPNLYREQRSVEPRQHLVGYLSRDDAHDYLKAVVVRDGEPVISDDFRERIIRASSGLPMYLDLAVTIYLDTLARGKVPQLEDFGQPLPAVVVRVLRDLDPQERGLLRAAALVDGFDLELLRAAVPGTPDAALRRFRDRPFLDPQPTGVWPFALHDVLRQAVLAADIDLPDSWSERERAEVARRMTGHLSQVVADAARVGDHSTEVAAFKHAMDLTALSGEVPDWVVVAAQRLVMIGRWGAIAGDTEADGDGLTAALRLGLQSARERRSGAMEAAISKARTALERPGLPHRLERFLRLHHGHALRVAGRYAEAAEEYETLAAGDDEFMAEAGYWLADYRFLQGSFPVVLDDLRRLPEPSAELRGEMLRLTGHVHRVNALFPRAEATYREALELARDTRNTAAEGKALTDLVQTLCWSRSSDVAELLSSAVDVNAALRNNVELVKLHAADAVAAALQGDSSGAEDQIRQGLALSRQCGYPGGEIWCQVAAVVLGLRTGDTETARVASERVESLTDTLAGNRFWAQITAWWVSDSADIETTGVQPSIQWLDGGVAAAKQRWLAVGVT